ncbi:MAG: hypothetical protein V2G42_00375 [bacterium JZ-2024 1]
MAFRLACELSDKIAGIAPVTTSLSDDLIRVCKPNHPVTVMILNGTEDPLVPYDSATIGFGSRKPGKVISANETARFWAKWIECAFSPEIIRVPERDQTDGTTLIKEVYGGCKDGVSVVLCAVKVEGHT